MNAAWADQADEMKAMAATRRAINSVQQSGIFEEGATLHLGVDARQVLHHGPPRAKVEVAHLAVAHLPLGQTDGAL